MEKWILGMFILLTIIIFLLEKKNYRLKNAILGLLSNIGFGLIILTGSRLFIILGLIVLIVANILRWRGGKKV
jgi:hypothetical protein